MPTDSGMGDLDGGRKPRFSSPQPAVERHLQTILTSCVLAGIIWATSALVDLKTKNAEMSTSQNQLVEQVKELKLKLDSQNADRYTSSMAERDFTRVNQQVLELRDRIDRLERKGMRE